MRHDESQTLAIGTLLSDRYVVKEFLGSGGMGWVFRVEDRSLQGNDLALKLLYPHLVRNEESFRRFRNETLISRKLVHQNIVRTYTLSAAGEHRQFITMEFVDGGSLAEAIKENDALPFETAIDYLYLIAAGMGHAHNRGVIHRDLKPDNIMVSNQGEIKIADFGISRLLNSSSGSTVRGQKVVGTPYYMAPEQLQAEVTDQRTDIYAFGLIAYELVTGQRAFSGASFFSIAEQQLTSPMPPINDKIAVPQWFEEFVHTCTEKKRDERFQSFDEIGVLLAKHCSVSLEEERGYREDSNEISFSKLEKQNLEWRHRPPEERKAAYLVARMGTIWALFFGIGTLLAIVFSAPDTWIRTGILLFLLVLVLRFNWSQKIGYSASFDNTDWHFYCDSYSRSLEPRDMEALCYGDHEA